MATATIPSLTDQWNGVAPTAATVRQPPAAPPLSLLRIAFQASGLLALLLLNKWEFWGALGFFIILAIMALSSSRRAFQALAICYLGLMIHQAYVPKSIPWTAGRLVIPALVLVRFAVDLVGMQRARVAWAPYLTLVLYIAVMAVCSVLGGWLPTIALLKLLNFFLMATAVFFGAAVLRTAQIDITEWMVSLITTATAVGVLSLITGTYNQSPRFANNADVFLGAFLHPNCHSLYASMFIVFLLSVWMCTRYRQRWLMLPLTGIWLIFEIWSKSRSALAATVVGLVVLAWYARPLRNRLGQWMKANVSRPALAALVIAVMLAGGLYLQVKSGNAAKAVIAYVNKGGSGEELDVEQIIYSREGLIGISWSNFLESPIYGIGFGLTKTEEFRRSATMFTAPSEKGFLPTALLEEGGLLGTAAFVIFLLTFTNTLLRERNVPALAVFATFLASNFGEVAIFAPGGSGGFGWLMVGASMILGDHIWSTSGSIHGSR